MEIQQHDGVVVEVAGIPAGLRQAQAGERGVTGGRGRRQGLGYGCPPSPTIYRTPRGAPARDPIWMGGGGQGGALPPKASGKPLTLGFPTLGAGGRPMGGRPAH